jgi:NAD(P)-dependent dehydrogenase (short-subunit alcohol dehydrogenase family)
LSQFNTNVLLILHFRVISVAGLSYLWDTSVIPYDDLTWKVTSWNSLAAYGQSNLARVLFTRELSRRAKLNGDKLTSYAVHPGIVATRFNQKEKVI